MVGINPSLILFLCMRLVTCPIKNTCSTAAEANLGATETAAEAVPGQQNYQLCNHM